MAAAAAHKRKTSAGTFLPGLFCGAVGHTKCPIFDTKYTDRKNRVNYA